jgi:nucleoside-diphosphate-sugar epimerase
MIALVTGATGLIGNRFLEKYASAFSKIYCLGRKPVDCQCEWIEFDLVEPDIKELPEIEVLFHFAGQTSVYHAKENVQDDLSVNVCGFLHLLWLLKKQSNIPFVVYAGTATEVGLTYSELKINESHCDRPNTFYDISKLTAENYLLQFVREGWLNGCSLRLCNVYGGMKNGQNIERGIIDKVFQQSLRGEALKLFGDGNYLRDYIHIDDVVDAFYLAFQNQESVNGAFYYIGSGNGVLLKDAFSCVAKLAESVTETPVKISSVEPPSHLSSIEFRSFVSDHSAFSKATGWIPEYRDLNSGIKYSYRHLF